jgi:hypothetical protein
MYLVSGNPMDAAIAYPFRNSAGNPASTHNFDERPS